MKNSIHPVRVAVPAVVRKGKGSVAGLRLRGAVPQGTNPARRRKVKDLTRLARVAALAAVKGVKDLIRPVRAAAPAEVKGLKDLIRLVRGAAPAEVKGVKDLTRPVRAAAPAEVKEWAVEAPG